MNIDNLFEVAVKVKNLDVSARFYEKVLGFRKGLFDEQRRWLFLWVGNDKGMVVLQEDQGEWPRQHFAFRVGESELAGLKKYLEIRNVTVEGPVSLDWMNAVSVYFSDPDGHDLELCAIRTRDGQQPLGRSESEYFSGVPRVRRWHSIARRESQQFGLDFLGRPDPCADRHPKGAVPARSLCACAFSPGLADPITVVTE